MWLGVAVCLAACGPAQPGAAPKTLAEHLAEPDPLRRLAGVGSWLEAAPPERLDAVLEAFSASALDGNDPEFVALAHWWARFDPEAALAWALKDPRVISYSVISAVYRSWANRDPAAAWRHAGSASPDLLEAAKAGVFAGWEESDPESLIAMVRGIQPSADRQRASGPLARRRVLSLGPSEAIAWADSLGNADGFASEMGVRVAGEVALIDPAAVLDWAEARMQGAARPTGIPRRIGTRWIHRDPLAAMEWLSSLPEGRDRDDGVMETFRDWRSGNGVEANAWIRQQEVEPWVEPALALYAGQLGEQRPEEALALVASFSNTGLRERFTSSICRKWLRRDYDAAHAWLEEAEMPDAMRKNIYVVTAENPRKAPRKTRRPRRAEGD